MANDIYVSFGADSSSLESSFALAKAQASSFSREMTALARSITQAGAAADSELMGKLNSLGTAQPSAQPRRDWTARAVVAANESRGRTS